MTSKKIGGQFLPVSKNQPSSEFVYDLYGSQSLFIAMARIIKKLLSEQIINYNQTEF